MRERGAWPGKVRVEFDGPTVLRFPSFPVPIRPRFDARQRGMDFREHAVELQGFRGGRLRLRRGLACWNEALLLASDPNVGDPRIGLGIVGVFGQGRFEVLKRAVEVRPGELVPSKLALETGLIGLGIDLAGARQTGLFLRGQLDLHPAGDGPGHFAVHHQHVRHGPVVGLRPDVSLFGEGVDQFHPDPHPVANPVYGPLDDGLHLELAGDLRHGFLRSLYIS